MEKKLNNQFAWNFVFPMELRLRNHWKCCTSVLGSTLSRTQVFEWHKAFSEGREVVENLPLASRPSTSVNDDNIEKVKKIVFGNRRVGIREVAEALEISYWSIHTKVTAQPPYSPDLAPCDFFLFPKFKYPLRGTRHESIGAIKRNSLKKLKAIPANAYKKCIENWIKRWHACIGSKRAYFEGDNKYLY